jgi:hypothetical protein
MSQFEAFPFIEINELPTDAFGDVYQPTCSELTDPTCRGLQQPPIMSI